MDQIYKTDLNELFSYQRKGEKLEEKEKVIEIEIERLRDFKEHPFHVKDDKEMSLLKESIKNYGILSPLIVRPVLDGVYEIVSGHRRKYAAQQLGYYKLPVIIRVMNDDEAIISMVDSNLQRERILERNQKRVRSNHKEFLFDDLGNEEDIFEEVNDFVDEISRKDFVMRMMDDLNEYQRTIIDLFYFRQWKQKEIAQYLGVSQQNVSSILSRSLKNLAEYAKKNKYF